MDMPLQLSEENLLPFLRRIEPVTGYLLVGAGTGDRLIGDIEQAVLLEAQDARKAKLAATYGQRPEWSVHSWVLSETEAEVEFFTASNLNESGLIRPEDLAFLWPNLKTVESRRVPTLTLEGLLDRPELAGRAENLNWLDVDCLPALPVIRGVGERLAQFDVVIARAIIDGAPAEIEETAGRAALDAFMAARGFAEIALFPERHPMIARIVYYRQWKMRPSGRTATFAETHDRLVKAHRREIEAYDRNLAERDRELAEAENALRDLTTRHEEARHLAETRKAQIAKLSAERDKQPALFDFPAIERLRSIGDKADRRRMYLEVKSLPRSGLHYLHDSLQNVLGSAFSSCEWYQEPGCCHRMPCTLTGFLEGSNPIYVRMAKSHDFELSDPVYTPEDPVQRLILIRDPIFIISSWWALHTLQRNAEILKRHGINMPKINYLHERAVVSEAYSIIDNYGVMPDESVLNEWLSIKKTYISRFVRKWCDPQIPLGRIMPYNQVRTEIQRLLDSLHEAMNDKTRLAFSEFLTGQQGAFHPRQDAFSVPSTKISNFLQNHSASFRRVAEEIVEADSTGCLASLTDT